VKWKKELILFYTGRYLFTKTRSRLKQMKRRVECKHLPTNSKGRKLVTKVARNPGDVILKSTPFCSVVSQDKLSLTCSNCYITQEYCSQKLLRCVAVSSHLTTNSTSLSAKASTIVATHANEQIGTCLQKELVATSMNAKVFKRLLLTNLHNQFDYWQEFYG
jgi:hypothetical protein